MDRLIKRSLEIMGAVGDHTYDQCLYNCSGHGMCMEGKCFCEVQFSGGTCADVNMRYFVSFGAVFYFLSAVSIIQLFMCMRADYMKQQKASWTAAVSVTSQKLLYVFVILASAIRGIYFSTKNTIRVEWASNLLLAYYPFLLSGVSLVICLWAEAFHLNDVRLDRPRFLSKSLVSFYVFNAFVYHVVVSCSQAFHLNDVRLDRPRFLSKSLVSFYVFNAFVYLVLMLRFIATDMITDSDVQGLVSFCVNAIFAFLMFVAVIFFLVYGVETYFRVHGAWSNRVDTQKWVNTTQLHMSRLGLVVQAGLQVFTIMFLVWDIMGDKWKQRLKIRERNCYDVLFRVAELGVALWFPCCLWNWSSPEQLWILNPKKILKQLDLDLDRQEDSETDRLLKRKYATYNTAPTTSAAGEPSSTSKECWICYDMERRDAGELIEPCGCRGDVAVVHHDCLRRWLMESLAPDDLHCKVCKQMYHVKEGAVWCFWLPVIFTQRHWTETVALLLLMAGAPVGSVVILRTVDQTFLQILAIGGAGMVEYVCMRRFGFSLIAAYNRARLQTVQILGRRAVWPETGDQQKLTIGHLSSITSEEATVEVHMQTPDECI
ncbi:PREDICTED: uncharacterized protein LOC106810939 [Priapulus caudatus]|uniref:Uncharacterized protein LOC106810939 n=1 Tax=Priapulus caudatus TaxID=37621 RepID=A0ABM1ECI9_PRICU|nr:PREDICTED: uncharacterized protein LOC106810939 [Priapulus caudatus]